MQLISSLLINWLSCFESVPFQLCPAACSAGHPGRPVPCRCVCVKDQQEAAAGAVAGQVLVCVISCLSFSWDLMRLLNLFLSSKIL